MGSVYGLGGSGGGFYCPASYMLIMRMLSILGVESAAASPALQYAALPYCC